jgi:hypothetical protein
LTEDTDRTEHDEDEDQDPELVTDRESMPAIVPPIDVPPGTTLPIRPPGHTLPVEPIDPT